jgi:hypothetical protein
LISIYDRLDKIINRITDPAFLQNKGLGNEIGYYIFDYDPRDEILVREHISFIKQKINNGNYGIEIQEFDLYEIMLEILEQKGYLQKAFELEEQKGSDYIINAIKKALRLTLKNDLIVDYIVERVKPNSVIFITGVGKVYPIIRSHTILNNLHGAVDHVPVVMFFPGSYDGLELSLFNEIKDDNYYRAFQLIEK